MTVIMEKKQYLTPTIVAQVIMADNVLLGASENLQRGDGSGGNVPEAPRRTGGATWALDNDRTQGLPKW